MVIAGGTALGGLHHKKLGMSDEDKIRLSSELQGGKAAVGVMAHPEDSGAVVARLTDLGGVPEQFAVAEEAVTAANDAVAAAQTEG